MVIEIETLSPMKKKETITIDGSKDSCSVIVHNFDGAEIDFASPAIGDLLHAIFDLNYLNHVDENGVRNSETIITAVCEMLGIDASDYGLDEMNFEVDGQAIVDLYYRYQEIFADAEADFPIKNVSSLSDPQFMNNLIDFALSDGVASYLLDLIYDLLDIPTINGIALIGAYMGLDMVTNMNNPIINSLNLGELSEDQLLDDLYSILYIVEVLIEDGWVYPGLDIIGIIEETTEFYLPPYFFDGLNEIISTIEELNVLHSVPSAVKYVLTEMLVSPKGTPEEALTVFDKINTDLIDFEVLTIENICCLILTLFVFKVFV